VEAFKVHLTESFSAILMRSVAEKLPELRIAIAQAERERVSERTKRALERLREPLTVALHNFRC